MLKFFSQAFGGSSDKKDEVVIEGKKFDIIEKIAEGGYGVIFRGTDENGTVVAIKTLNSPDNERFMRNQAEVEVQRKLSSHPNIVKVFGCSTDPVSKQCAIAMEYCESDLVKEMAKNAKTGFSPKIIAEIFYSVCSAVSFMHKQDPPIIHRDLKVENILYSRGMWKLCDFGSATTKILDPSKLTDVQAASSEIMDMTTPTYRAPEMVDLYRGTIIGPKSDVWALGCILFKLCTMKDAFPDGSTLQILNGRYSWNCDVPVDERFKSVVEQCLKTNPDERPTAEELCERMKTEFGVTEPQPINTSITQQFSAISQQIIQRSTVQLDPYEEMLLHQEAPVDEDSDISDIELCLEEGEPLNYQVPNMKQQTVLMPSSSSMGIVFKSDDEDEKEVIEKPPMISAPHSQNVPEFKPDFSFSETKQTLPEFKPDFSQAETKPKLPEFNPDFSQVEQKGKINFNQPSVDMLIDFGAPAQPAQQKQEAQQPAQQKQDSQAIDLLFGITETKPLNDISSLYDTNKGEFAHQLINSDDTTLPSTLFKLSQKHPDCGEFLLSVIQTCGIKARRVLINLPPLPASKFTDYMESRKRFALAYNQFEGNFSLAEFTKTHRANPPPPGEPPICLDAVKQLQSSMDLLIPVLRESPSQLLLDEALSLYQIIAYIIAKLVQFNVSKGFVQSTIIPYYNNQHNNLKKAFDNSKLNINFPAASFNFSDQNIIKRLRPPPSKVKIV